MSEYAEKPCECGFVPKENPEKFEKYEMKMGSIFGKDLGTRNAWRCVDCNETALLIRQEVIKNEFAFEGLD